MRATFDFNSLFPMTTIDSDAVSKETSKLYPYGQFFEQICEAEEKISTHRNAFPKCMHIRQSYILSQTKIITRLQHQLNQILDNQEQFEEDVELLQENCLLARLNQKEFVDDIATISKSTTILNKLVHEIRQFCWSQKENTDLEYKLEEALDNCEFNNNVLSTEAKVLGIEYDEEEIE